MTVKDYRTHPKVYAMQSAPWYIAHNLYEFIVFTMDVQGTCRIYRGGWF